MRNYIEQDKLDNYFNNSIKHLNIEINVSNDNFMFFYDMLSFGTFKVITSQDDLNKKLLSLGSTRKVLFVKLFFVPRARII